jgi:hypothetical protein
MVDEKGRAGGSGRREDVLHNRGRSPAGAAFYAAREAKVELSASAQGSWAAEAARAVGYVDSKKL